MKLKLTLWLWLLSVGSLLWAQELTQTVKGQVTDEQSGSPIIGATVMIVGTAPPIGAITDAEGIFRINDVPIGRQTLFISYLGYKSVTITDVLIGAAKEGVAMSK